MTHIQFNIIPNRQSIPIQDENGWEPLTQAEQWEYDYDLRDCKNYNEKGEKITSDHYDGPKYQLVDAKTCSFSVFERIVRSALGALIVLCTLGTGLLSKKIRKQVNQLLTEPKKIIRLFAICVSDRQAMKTKMDTAVAKIQNIKQDFPNLTVRGAAFNDQGVAVFGSDRSTQDFVLLGAFPSDQQVKKINATCTYEEEGGSFHATSSELNLPLEFTCVMEHMPEKHPVYYLTTQINLLNFNRLQDQATPIPGDRLPQ